MFTHLLKSDLRVPSHITNPVKGIAHGRGGISAQVIEASYHHEKVRPLITMQLRYPRFIHSEFMTHRVFSRNAGSSRAIPVAKMIEQVRNDPAKPIHWGKNQAGMQANEELDAKVLISDGYGCNQAWAATVDEAWGQAAREASCIAEAMSLAGYHKQVVNRLLEPFQFMHVIVTATEWDNFFELRAHKDAQPEIQELAYCMLQAARSANLRFIQQHQRLDVKWNQVDPDDWHLPYVTNDERATLRLPILLAVSAARCARVSYLKHDGTASSVAEDVRLFLRLVGSAPLHASPIEHQGYGAGGATSGNFKDFIQFRQVYKSDDSVWAALRSNFAEKAEALA